MYKGICTCLLILLGIVLQQVQAADPQVQFNFVDAPLGLVLGQLNQSSEVQYVLDQSIVEKVNLKKDGITLNRAIDMLKEEYQLIEVKQGNKILLTRKKPRAAPGKRTTTSKKTPEPVPQFLRVYTPKYISSDELASLLDPRVGGVLSASSRVREEKTGNQLIVSTSLGQHQQIESLLDKIDKIRMRVRVYSRIVIMRKKAKRELGNRLGIRTEDGYTALAGGIRGPFLPATIVNTFTNNLAVDFGVISQGGKLGVGYKYGKSLIELEFQALETSGLIDVVATPQVMVNSGQLAYIATGAQIPYLQKNQDGDFSVRFKDALLSLQVIPRVESPNRVNLAIKFAMDTVGVLYSGVPAINTNKLNTKVQISPGQTLVLGGIYSKLQSSTVSKVPFLGDLPLIGYLFRYNSTSIEEAELLIFLTPELVTQ